MRYFSLFSGIGGFELGIKNYVDTINRGAKQRKQTDSETNDENRSRLVATKGKGDGTPARRTGQYDQHWDHSGEFTCVGFSEINKYAVEIYQKHFPNHKNYGDITKIEPATIPDFDILVGGFPCQAFSIAGKRGGFNDTRGTLFFEIARILKVKRPRYFLLENVKGLLSHDGGNTFKTIISTLDELGYDLQWQVLNSKNFGVPQNRERVYIVGHTRGERRPEIFPIRESEEVRAETQQAEEEEVAPCLGSARGGADINDLFVFDLKAQGSQTRRGVVSKGITKTLDHNCLQAIMRKGEIRRLTPIECERLQGFPDNWTEGLSDTQRYKTLGNAVTVNVIEQIIKRM